MTTTMKLAISQPTDVYPRHLVLIADASLETQHKVSHGVLAGKKKPLTSEKNGSIWYRFHLRYLDRILAFFPEVELSEGVKRHKVEAVDVPEGFTIPGYNYDKFDLYPFQRHDIWRAINDDSFMLHWDMGIGKTAAAYCTIQYKHYTLNQNMYPCLVVCPNSVKPVWRDEATKFFGNEISTRIIDGNKQRKLSQLRGKEMVKILNYESLRIMPLDEIEWGSVIFDECHRISNPGAKMTRAAHHLRETPFKIFLSGTPCRNGRYEELWSPLKIGWPTHWQEYNPFINRYTIRQNKTWVIGYKNTKEIDSFLVSHAARRRKEDVLKDLPAVTNSVQEIELAGDQKRIYEQARDNFILDLGNGQSASIPTVLSQLTRLKQICFSPELYGGEERSAKVDLVKEVVEDLKSEGHKALIFSQWSTATRILERELSEYNPAYIDGTVDVEQRAREVIKLQEDKDCHCFIGTYGSTAEGLTLTAASWVILTDLPWTPATIEQSIARAHRMGQKLGVNVLEIRASGTIEETINDKLIYKRDMIRKIVDRGETEQYSQMIIKSIKELLEAERASEMVA